MQNLLLLHGALASKAQFDPLLPLLSDRFNAEAINFSGHGGFQLPAQGYTFNTFASDILAYADSRGIKKLNLFGYSMGGYAALYFAKLHPHRVEKIFAVNVKFNWDPMSTAKETGLLNPDKLLEKVPAFANNLMMQHGMDFWKGVLKSTSDMMHNLSRQVMLTDEDYAAITCPVMLAVGDRDTTSSVEETLNVYRKLKNASLWVIPATPHPFDKISQQSLLNSINNFFSE